MLPWCSFGLRKAALSWWYYYPKTEHQDSVNWNWKKVTRQLEQVRLLDSMHQLMSLWLQKTVTAVTCDRVLRMCTRIRWLNDKKNKLDLLMH